MDRHSNLELLGYAALAPVAALLIFWVLSVGLRWLRLQRLELLRGDSILPWQACLGVALVFVVGSTVFGALLFNHASVGLLSVLLVPSLIKGVQRVCAGQYRFKLEQSAVSYFYALQGLVRSGISFPTAVFEIARNQPTVFAQVLNDFVEGYEKGKSLSHCLSKFRLKSGLPFTGFVLSVLELAYREGLPLAPFLERVTPIVEKELGQQDKIKKLRQSLAVQLGVAALVPAFVLFTLQYFEPGRLEFFLAQWWCGWLLLAVFVYVGMGVFVIWNVSKFY